jgi:hypothetical protein
LYHDRVANLVTRVALGLLAFVLGASGRSPTKKLSMFKRRARARGRRLAWQRLWCGSGGRSVLGCVDHGLGGEIERQQGGV